MRLVSGLVVVATLAACASFTAVDPPAPASGGEDAGRAATDADASSADAAAAAAFCESAPNELCVDFERELEGGSWSGAPSIAPTQSAGEVVRIAAPARPGTTALRAKLVATGSRSGATLELSTTTLPAAMHVEFDIYIPHPQDPLGSAVTLVALSRDQASGFLAEVNLTAFRGAKAALSLYAEAGGVNGDEEEKDAFEIECDTWQRIRLAVDLVGEGTGRAQVTLVGAVPVKSPSVDIARVPAPLVSAVATGIGLWREAGQATTALEAYFDNVVEGPGL